VAPIIIAFLIVLALYVGTKRLSGLALLGVAALAGLGIILAIFPELSTRVAGYLHVGRGTDLILYIAVLAGLFIASNFYLRFKRHEEALVALARQSAIDHAREPQGVAPESLGPKGDRTVEQVQKNLDRIES
jgi:small membrane protein